jgi:hypothetical protein
MNNEQQRIGKGKKRNSKKKKKREKKEKYRIVVLIHCVLSVKETFLPLN